MSHKAETPVDTDRGLWLPCWRQGPESRRYGPLVVFLLVLALFLWAYALRVAGAK